MDTFFYEEHDVVTLMEFFDTVNFLLKTVILLLLDNDFESFDFVSLYHISNFGVDSHFHSCNIAIS